MEPRSTKIEPFGKNGRNKGGAPARQARSGHLFGPLLIRSPHPRDLHWFGIWTGPLLVGDMDWPLPVEDTHPQKLVLSCWAPKGVRRWLGVKALPVFVNILTMLYNKLARLTG